MNENSKPFGSAAAGKWVFGLVPAAFLLYYFCNPSPQYYYDYTFRVAENFLYGYIPFYAKPPSWLNEFVPFEGKFFSVFPLGSVLTMVPFAFLKVIGIIADMPGAFIAALIAGLVGWFLLLIARRYDLESKKRLLLASGIVFGTWMWTNLAMAGAWHLALGWAMVGELGAIYFTVFNRRPVLAGAFFALAFGNRTEILLTAPFFLGLLVRETPVKNPEVHAEKEPAGPPDAAVGGRSLLTADEENIKGRNTNRLVKQLPVVAGFCLVPFVLGLATLGYNFLRFHSFTDFGYARIPGVLDEPWYRHGIFSIYNIPLNLKEMLFTPWRALPQFPFLVPTGFGGAIWWSSPFLFLLGRFGARDKTLKYAAWAAILTLTFILWIHGNPGGWQFGYRYAMILLPWAFLILLENSPRRLTRWEKILFPPAFVINAWATYLFFWTDHVRP